MCIPILIHIILFHRFHRYYKCKFCVIDVLCLVCVFLCSGIRFKQNYIRFHHSTLCLVNGFLQVYIIYRE